MMTMVQRPLLYYAPQRVLQSTVYTKQVLCHTCSMYPDHPLTLESVQVHLVYIVGGSKHYPIPLPCVQCHGTPRLKMAGVISQC